MEHDGALDLGGGVETVDRHAGLVGARIAAGGEDHGDRRVGRPVHLHVREPAGGAREQEVRQIGAQPRDHDLGLGVAEPAVVLEDLRAVGGEHQPRVEEPPVRQALGGHRGHGAPAQVPDLALGRIVDPRKRRVRAHAAGVRPGVAVARSLEVLAEHEGHDGLAVRQGERAHLGALEDLLDHHGGSRLAEGAALEAVPERPHGRLAIRRHRDALARREPVGLHHGPSAQRVHERDGVVERGERAARSGRDAAAGHDLLRERLGTLEPGRGGVGAEGRNAAVTQGVGEARHERGLRADHDEIGSEPPREAPRAPRRPLP